MNGYFKHMKKALITGISGQDGSYLASYLLGKGYKVFGTSRDIDKIFFRLKYLDIFKEVQLIPMSYTNFDEVYGVISDINPDEIYNLAGLTSVGMSFENPLECEKSIVGGVINLLESIRKINNPIKFFNASSSEMFGDTGSQMADENHPLKPVSPYGVSKASSFMHVKSYREAYGIFACSGIMGNHESALRGSEFVTQKIVNGARDISLGKKDYINLGNLNTIRDWGCAFEYVEAMHLMLSLDKPSDFVISSGISNSLENFAKEIFKIYDLNLSDHLKIDQSLFRPNDINISRLNPNKAKKLLGWEASIGIKKLAEIMTSGEHKHEK